MPELHERTNILGVGISAVSLPMAADEVQSWIQQGKKNYVCIRDAHGVVLCQGDEELRQIHNAAGLVTPDGMPLVWLSRWHGKKHVTRVYGPDLLLELCRRAAESGHRLFFYGGAPGVAEQLTQKMLSRFPGLQIAGTYSPPFRSLTAEEEVAIAARINAAKPDIVWVGLSTPKQERWMAGNRHRLEAAALIGIGAAFDFHAGVKSQAPRWIQRSGFEWLYRLISEPRRLGRRYLHVIPRFVFFVLLQELRLKRYVL